MIVKHPLIRTGFTRVQQSAPGKQWLPCFRGQAGVMLIHFPKVDGWFMAIADNIHANMVSYASSIRCGRYYNPRIAALKGDEREFEFYVRLATAEKSAVDIAQELYDKYRSRHTFFNTAAALILTHRTGHKPAENQIRALKAYHAQLREQPGYMDAVRAASNTPEANERRKVTLARVFGERRTCVVDGQVYSTFKAAGDAHGLAISSARHRVESNKPDYVHWVRYNKRLHANLPVVA